MALIILRSKCGAASRVPGDVPAFRECVRSVSWVAGSQRHFGALKAYPFKLKVLRLTGSSRVSIAGIWVSERVSRRSLALHCEILLLNEKPTINGLLKTPHKCHRESRPRFADETWRSRLALPRRL